MRRTAGTSRSVARTDRGSRPPSQSPERAVRLRQIGLPLARPRDGISSVSLSMATLILVPSTGSSPLAANSLATAKTSSSDKTSTHQREQRHLVRTGHPFWIPGPEESENLGHNLRQCHVTPPPSEMPHQPRRHTRPRQPRHPPRPCDRTQARSARSRLIRNALMTGSPAALQYTRDVLSLSHAHRVP